jgi:hypothetical protein
MRALFPKTITSPLRSGAFARRARAAHRALPALLALFALSSLGALTACAGFLRT